MNLFSHESRWGLGHRPSCCTQLLSWVEGQLVLISLSGQHPCQECGVSGDAKSWDSQMVIWGNFMGRRGGDSLNRNAWGSSGRSSLEGRREPISVPFPTHIPALNCITGSGGNSVQISSVGGRNAYLDQEWVEQILELVSGPKFPNPACALPRHSLTPIFDFISLKMSPG